MLGYIVIPKDNRPVEIVILLVVALGGMAAFFAGAVLLYFYLRSGRERDYYDDEPAVYGNLVQCPHCGYMNPLDSAACLNCRQPLPRPAGYPAPASYAAPAPQTRMVPTPAPGVNPHRCPARPHSSARCPTSAPRRRPRRARPVPNRPGMPHLARRRARRVQGQTAVVARVDTLVGRSTVCDVRITIRVSRRHFQIASPTARSSCKIRAARGARASTASRSKLSACTAAIASRWATELIFHVEA